MDATKIRERLAQGDPLRPVCVGCGRTPDELLEYTARANDIEEGFLKDARRLGCTPAAAVVIVDDGTYNRENGHFACTPCYLDMGQPVAPRGWHAP